MADDSKRDLGKVISFPKRVAPQPTPVAEPTFAAFHREVMSSDLEAAGQILARLFNTTPSLAKACASYYADRITLDPEHVRVTMGLREAVLAGKQNDALWTLQQSFGVGGSDALKILDYLRGSTFKR